MCSTVVVSVVVPNSPDNSHVHNQCVHESSGNLEENIEMNLKLGVSRPAVKCEE